MNNYAVKLLIDLFTKNQHITFAQSWQPIALFVGAQIVIDSAWRAHNFVQLKCMPYILQNMLDKVCKHCFNLSYTFFQNNLTGSIVVCQEFSVNKNVRNIIKAISPIEISPLFRKRLVKAL